MAGNIITPEHTSIAFYTDVGASHALVTKELAEGTNVMAQAEKKPYEQEKSLLGAANYDKIMDRSGTFTFTPLRNAPVLGFLEACYRGNIQFSISMHNNLTKQLTVLFNCVCNKEFGAKGTFSPIGNEGSNGEFDILFAYWKGTLYW